MASNRLNISVGIHQPQSRAGLITSATLPDASEIGIKLDGYDDADNIKFTAATVDAKQVWNPASDIVLDENKGTLYAYYPYAAGTNLTAITVETASQTDYLYATPVTGISETKANADVVMNHVLTNINLSFADGTYAGVGNITSVSVSGDGIATGGTFNAAQETPGFVADSYTGVGDAITNTTATTLGGNAIDIMVVSNDAEKPITIAATIDGVEYTATTTAVELAKGNSYQYTLTLNSTFLSVSRVTVTPWNNVVTDNLTLENDMPVEGTIDLKTASNGVYAVAQNGKGVAVADADESCIAVALISANQKVMIAKADATDGTNKSFYWGWYLYDQDVPNLTEVTETNAARQDFNGKANTAAIVAAYGALGKDMHSMDMCKMLETYNEGGYTDWYVPAAGQLFEISNNKAAINEALTAIRGNNLSMSYRHWSSSEYDTKKGRYVELSGGLVGVDNKSYSYIVRLVRDIN